MFYKNMKLLLRSPNRVNNFFDRIFGGLWGNRFAPYLFILCLDYLYRVTIDQRGENGFTLKKESGRIYAAEIMVGANQAENLEFLANTPAQAEF